MSDIESLPTCVARKILDDATIYCRHQNVQGFPGNIVTPKVCMGCIWHEVYCDLRPEIWVEPPIIPRPQYSASDPVVAPLAGGCGCGGSLEERMAKTK